MITQVGQGTVQLLLEQGRTFICGGGWFLAYNPVQAAGCLGVGADGVAPFPVEGCARAVVLCVSKRKDGKSIMLL